MKISYAVTVCNEFVEIQKLVNFLLEHKRLQDEIVILYDEAHGDPRVEEFLRAKSINGGFNWHSGIFNNHFSEWKNHLNELCFGDVIVNLDADELPSEEMIENLPTLLENYPEIDLFRVPRINLVEGLTQEHINQWGWDISTLEGFEEEKILDLSNPKDLDEYNLLKKYNLIIKEDKIP